MKIAPDIRHYAHFRLSGDEYPRITATRRIRDDEASYFGPFLPEPEARKLFHFIIKTFRLRSCEIDVDGSASFPCPLFYEGECCAPCDRTVCDLEEYRLRIELTKLFLKNKRQEFIDRIRSEMDREAGRLEFEEAARWRKILERVRAAWKRKKWRFFWEDGITDTWRLRDGDGPYHLDLVSHYGNRVLGNGSFEIASSDDAESYLAGFYQRSVPARIRILFRIPDFASLKADLRRIHGTGFSFEHAGKAPPTAAKGFNRYEFEANFPRRQRPSDWRKMSKMLKKSLGLRRYPRWIDSIDVAHTTGKYQIAAKSHWQKGRFRPGRDEVWSTGRGPESAAIEQVVSMASFPDTSPGMILVDGAMAQFNAVGRALTHMADPPAVVAASKERNGSGRIGGLIVNGKRLSARDTDRMTLAFLTELRDSAHSLANRSHRLIRDTSPFYRLARTLPDLREKERRLVLKKLGSVKKILTGSKNELISELGRDLGRKVFESRRENPTLEQDPFPLVPIRHVEPDGDADNLLPKSNYRLDTESVEN